MTKTNPFREWTSCIQPVPRRLHWLPVRQRVDNKLATLVYQALHGLLPSYLSEDCQLTADTGRRQLRSSNTNDTNVCFVPRSHSSFGDGSFSVAGPTLWNSLPSSLPSFDNGFTTFKRLLKTYSFWWDQCAFVTFCLICALYKCSYLLTYLLYGMSTHTHVDLGNELL